MSSCRECDFTLSEPVREIVSIYQAGDQYLFYTDSGKTEMIRIIRIDSNEVCGTLMAPKRKSMDVIAEYISEDGDTIQFKLIEMTKEFYSSDTAGIYTLKVNFQYYSEYKTIKELSDHKPREWITDTPHPDGIVAIIWWGMERRGIMAYQKANGRRYSRRIH